MDDHSNTCSAGETFERVHVKPRPGRTLIVGSQVYRDKEDRRGRYKDVLGVDMLAGPGVDLVMDLEEQVPIELLQTFDHVECMSVLEHSRRPWLLAANLERLLRQGGTIFVTVPFMWRFHPYSDDYYRFTMSGIKALFPAVEWRKQAFVGQVIEPDTHVKAHKIGGHPHFPRTETMSFGVRR